MNLLLVYTCDKIARGKPVVEFLVQLSHNFIQISLRKLEFSGIFGIIGTNSG